MWGICPTNVYFFDKTENRRANAPHPRTRRPCDMSKHAISMIILSKYNYDYNQHDHVYSNMDYQTMQRNKCDIDECKT